MFEPRSAPLAPRTVFYWRIVQQAALTCLVLAGSLAVGMWGYWYFESLTWLDAYLNAAMLLGGMGPLEQPVTEGGKLFAGTYALYSGLVVLVSAGLLFAPVMHRLFHRFHLEQSAEERAPRARAQRNSSEPSQKKPSA